MKTHFCRTACVLFTLTIVLPCGVPAATVGFGPTPYLSSADRPAGLFCESCPMVLEDFEDGSYADSSIDISDGRILPPFSVSGLDRFVTDSVDGDDGTFDGNGNAGHSWFFAGSSVTITFDNPVKAAGLVWTDGDMASTNVIFSAYDIDLNLLLSLDGGDLADDFYTGETAEDRFLGVRSDAGIDQITIANTGGGSGIEIDHVQYQTCPECIPEPGALVLAFLALVTCLAWLRRA